MRGLVRSIVVAAVLGVAVAAAATAEAAKTPLESYPALQKQIAGGQVQTATVSPSKHTVKVKLKTGRKFAATYPASQQAALVASVKSKGGKVHVDRKKKKSSHFRLRYIVLIVLAVLVVGGGAAYLVQRRRAASSPGPPPAAPASP
jgi:ATP-dependent Zn protease